MLSIKPPYKQICLNSITFLGCLLLSINYIEAAPAIPTLKVNKAANHSEPEQATQIKPQLQHKDHSPLNLTAYKFGKFTNEASQLKIFKAGLLAIKQQDIPSAITWRNQLKQATIEYQLLSWLIAVSGYTTVSLNELDKASKNLAGWPQFALIKQYRELAFVASQPNNSAIIKFFNQSSPLTTKGKIAFTKALGAQGDTKKLKAIIIPWWLNARLTYQDEKQLFTAASKYLTATQIKDRLEFLLYNNYYTSAKLFAAPAGATNLINNFKEALAKGSTSISQQNLDPKWHNHDLKIYLEIQLLKKRHYYSKAAQLLIQTSKNKANLKCPNCWANQRLAIARQLISYKKYQLAYNLLEFNNNESQSIIEESKLLAGWLALKYLNNAPAAIQLFSKLLSKTSTDASKAKANYWLALAYEKDKNNSLAKKYFTEAAKYKTNFYGQLATEKIQGNWLSLEQPLIKLEQYISFSEQPVLSIIHLLHENGLKKEAYNFTNSLVSSIKTPETALLLAAFATKHQDSASSLQIAKIAKQHQIYLPSLEVPLGAINKTHNYDLNFTALLYAVAKQESAFKPQAISSAGASGLLQVMPATAKEVSRKLNIPFSTTKLSTDNNYNIKIAAHYLSELLKKFNNSYLLAIMAYNAGPSRIQKWIEKYGDPRHKDPLTILGWLQEIPFKETRNYAERVLENYQNYKILLNLTPKPLKDLSK